MKTITKVSLTTKRALQSLLFALPLFLLFICPLTAHGQIVVYGDLGDPGLEPGRDWIPWGGIQNGWRPGANVYLIGDITLLDSNVVIDSEEYTVFLGDPELAGAFGGCYLTIPNGFSLTVGKVEIPDGGEGQLSIQSGGSFSCSTLKVSQLFQDGQTIYSTVDIASGAQFTIDELLTIEQGKVQANGSCDVNALLMDYVTAYLSIASANATFTVTDDFTMNGGDFTVSAGSCTVGGSALFTGNSSITITGTPDVSFNDNLILVLDENDNEPSLTVDFSNVNTSMAVAGDINVAGATLSVDYGTISVEGDIIIGDYEETEEPGTVALTGYGRIVMDDVLSANNIVVTNGSTLALEGENNLFAIIRSANGEANGWGRIAADDGSVILSYAKVYGGGRSASEMIQITGSADLQVNNSELYNCSEGGIYLNTTAEPVISQSVLHDLVQYGIRVPAVSNLTIRNSFLHNISANGTGGGGTGIQCEDANDDIRIHNNFIFDCAGYLISLTENSGADILFNTLVNPGTYGTYTSAIAISGSANNCKIYNNIFSGYGTANGNGGVKVETERAQGDDAIDWNVFPETTAEFAYRNVVSPGGNPLVNETWSATPWDNRQDFTGFAFVNGVKAMELPYDFHVTGYNTNAARWCIPKFVNHGYNPVNEWWYGNDPDGSAPDAGAYGGKWADEFVNVPVSGTIYKLNKINDPYIWVKQGGFVSPPSNWGDQTRAVVADYYLFEGDDYVVGGTTLNIAAGTEMVFKNGYGLKVWGTLSANATGIAPIIMRGEAESTWQGITLYSSTNSVNSVLRNVQISSADYGIHFNGLSSMTKFNVDSCTVSDCATGIYINNSRVNLTNSSITDCDWQTSSTGIFMTNCSMGMVKVDNCTVSGNGQGSTIYSPGVYLTSSSPEFINSTIAGNNGGGLFCWGSNPDLNTWDPSGEVDRPNTICNNGGATQSGSDGAEIALFNSSYPSIQYNNIVDYSGGPVGKMIFKDQYSNSYSLGASNNFWGSTPDNSFFYWGAGYQIYYNPYSENELDNLNDLSLAVELWEKGNYAAALQLFGKIIFNVKGTEGVQAIHYLGGCAATFKEEKEIDRVRDLLLVISKEHGDPAVQKVARRFATNCLTIMGMYKEAMAEYDLERQNAKTVLDSVSAVIDYLSVAELANEARVDNLGSIRNQMQNAIARLQDPSIHQTILPNRVEIEGAYPNPFNSTTVISYSLPSATHLRITVFDVMGREVANLVNSVQEAGRYAVTWNGTNNGGIPVASGAYYYRLEGSDFTHTRKINLIK